MTLARMQPVRAAWPHPPTPRERFERDVIGLLGLPFDTLGLDAAVEKLRAAAFSNSRCFVATANVNFAMTARRDAGFRDSVLRSDLCLIDGAPIAWLARHLGVPAAERVAGADVFEAMCAHPGPPLDVFFFGGPPGVADAACRRLDASPCGLRCVGVDAAGFGSVEAMSAPERIARINRSGAHFVIVALGAAKGQAWIERNAASLQAPLLCHLGAVLNFAAGTVARAPDWLQRLGLEWLWRIKEEPHLWRRYGRDGAGFVGVAARLLLRYSVGRRDRRREGALSALRMQIAAAVADGKRLELDVADQGHLDPAFVGLLLLAHGSLGAAGLRLRGVSPRSRASLVAQGAGFLLAPAPGA